MKMKSLAFCLLLVGNSVLSVSPMKIFAILVTISDNSLNRFLNQSVLNYCSNEAFDTTLTLLLKMPEKECGVVLSDALQREGEGNLIERTVIYRAENNLCCLQAFNEKLKGGFSVE